MFCTIEICLLTLEYILTYGHVIHYFKAYTSESYFFFFFFFASDITGWLYLFYNVEMVLDKRQIEVFPYSSWKQITKQRRKLTALTMCLAQKLLMNTPGRGGSRCSAKETGLQDEEERSDQFLKRMFSQLH